MTPTRHPGTGLLLEYAAGTTGEAVALLVATHLALCPDCREEVALCEETGGALLDAVEPRPLRPGAFQALRERIAAEPPTHSGAAQRPLAPAMAPAPSATPRPILPEPLRSRLGGDTDMLPWRFKAPGAREVLLPLSVGAVQVRLARLSSWLRIPLHTHRGTEYTLVLAGGLRDEYGVFERGDVCVYDGNDRHEQRVLPGGPCICLVVNTGRLEPLTRLGRFLARFIDI